MSRSHGPLGVVLGLVSALVGGPLAAGCSGGSGTPDAAPQADGSMLPDGGGGVDGSIDATVPDGKLHIFDDNYGNDLTYAPFGGSVGAPTVDFAEHHSGAASLRIDVPASGYVGGTMTVTNAIDLSHYDAVTFYAKASKAVILDKAGFGIDNDTNLHTAELAPIPLTTEWQQIIVPIPLAAKVSAEKGLFHFADAAANDGNAAYTVWIDDVVFETVPTGVLTSKTASINEVTLQKLVGDTYSVEGPSVRYVVNGATPAQVIAISPSYFDFTSSDPTVATVSASGVVTALAVGTTTITAKLGDDDALGAVALTVIMPSVPDTGPTEPTALPADVISLFSNTYTNVPVDSFRTSWSDAQLTDVQLAGNDAKKYTSLKFVGLEFFATAPVDATTMTHFHVDFWTPDATAFKVKLVDFGANGIYQNGPGMAGSDDVESELTFDSASTPALVANTWISLDIPLTSFTALTTKAHLSQLILTSTNSTVYVDNLYFHK
jgi:hypothetical protein